MHETTQRKKNFESQGKTKQKMFFLKQNQNISQIERILKDMKKTSCQKWRKAMVKEGNSNRFSIIIYNHHLNYIYN